MDRLSGRSTSGVRASTAEKRLWEDLRLDYLLSVPGTTLVDSCSSSLRDLPTPHLEVQPFTRNRYFSPGIRATVITTDQCARRACSLV